MQLSTTAATLLPALQMLMGVIERKSTLPILSNVLIDVTAEHMVLLGSDGETELSVLVPSVTSTAPVSFTTSARKLCEICRHLSPDTEMTFVCEGSRLVITTNHSVFKMGVMASDQYPRMLLGPPLLEYTMEVSLFRQLLLNVAFAMANQDVRFFLNGVLLSWQAQCLEVVATDGHRLGMSYTNLGSVPSEPVPLILSRKAVLEIIRLLGETKQQALQVSYTEHHLHLSWSNHCFISKRIVGQYPNYHKVIPKQTKTYFEVDNASMRQALSRVMILANEKHYGVTLALQDHELTIEAANQEQEQAKERVLVDDGNYLGKISLNATYLVDVLQALPKGRVRFAFHSPEQGVLITAASQTVCYVIMPLRL